MIIHSLSMKARLILSLLAFFIVAFGQPAHSLWMSFFASFCGYAFFARVLLDISNRWHRFWLASAWYTAIHAVQLSWMVYHPYSYIYFVHSFFSLFWGMQMGFLALFITPENLFRFRRVISLAALWTLCEWGRLFFLSGYTWNPAGLALAGNLYSMQWASIGGVFFLSFWVLLVNLLALRAWLYLPMKRHFLLFLIMAASPYLFGIGHFYYHNQSFLKNNQKPFKSVLVQTAFPAEEAMPFKDVSEYIAYIFDEWSQILNILKPHYGKEIDLIALPEYVVPFNTYSYLYPYEKTIQAFRKTFGISSLNSLPPKEEPFASMYETPQGQKWFVNNAFWSQAIANLFQSELIAGLEDAENHAGSRSHFSAALHFKPNTTIENFTPQRYAKRVLLPIAEYIPSSYCRQLANSYGIQGSFTSGEEATVFQGAAAPFGASICYEETFGDLMRECRMNGAELLVNLTSDVWYPNSNLPKQHMDHARLRTVENGMPLLRACNTGITTAFDSLGREIATLGDTSPESQWMADALYVEVPRHHYQTLYSRVGDLLIVLLSFFSLLFFLF